MLGIGLAFSFGYSYHHYLTTGFSPWIVLGILLVFGAISALQVFLEKKAFYRMGLIFVETAVLLLPFFSMNLRLLICIGVLIFIFLFWGYLRGRSELRYGARIRFFKATQGVVNKLVTAVLVFMVVAYVLIHGIGGNIFVNDATFGGFFNWASGYFNSFYPTITVDGSFQDFAQSVARTQLATVPAFQTLTQGEQDSAVQSAGAAIEKNFSDKLDIAVAPSTPMENVVYSFIVHTLNDWRSSFSLWFAVIWGVTIFFTLRAFGIIFAWLAQFFSMLFYEGLLAIGIIQIVSEPQTKESVEFS